MTTVGLPIAIRAWRVSINRMQLRNFVVVGLATLVLGGCATRSVASSPPALSIVAFDINLPPTSTAIVKEALEEQNKNSSTQALAIRWIGFRELFDKDGVKHPYKAIPDLAGVVRVSTFALPVVGNYSGLQAARTPGDGSPDSFASTSNIPSPKWLIDPAREIETQPERDLMLSPAVSCETVMWHRHDGTKIGVLELSLFDVSVEQFSSWPASSTVVDEQKLTASITQIRACYAAFTAKLWRH
ncbi:hypothetical protein [Dongia sp.]|uniref:hypothetical protein n=1 Tax=Dongia sp. TaxID=1977262 RepID=UPI0035B47871